MENNQKSVKKPRGRQKIPMVCTEKESSRLVTFTKHRVSLFKKASELTTLCGAELAIIVFSPGRKAYSFGYPSVYSVLDRYQNDTSFFNYLKDYQIGQASDPIQDEEGGNIKELIQNLTILETQYETEKKRSEEINNRMQTHEEICKWTAMVENTKTLGELHKIKDALTHLNTILHQRYHVIELNANNGDVAGYRYPPNLLENQNSFPYNYLGDQPQIKLAMVPPDSVMHPNNFDPYRMRMAQAPPLKGAFGYPSSMSSIDRANTIAMNLLNADTEATLNYVSSFLEPMAQPGYPNNPNSMLPFPRGSNLTGDLQCKGNFSFNSMNPLTINPMWSNFQASTSISIGTNRIPTMPDLLGGSNELLSQPALPPQPRDMLNMPTLSSRPHRIDALAPPLIFRVGSNLEVAVMVMMGLYFGIRLIMMGIQMEMRMMILECFTSFFMATLNLERQW
ncbi:unnamed protein product [Amaranthus hypochondriacus]